MDLSIFNHRDYQILLVVDINKNKIKLIRLLAIIYKYYLKIIFLVLQKQWSESYTIIKTMNDNAFECANIYLE